MAIPRDAAFVVFGRMLGESAPAAANIQEIHENCRAVPAGRRSREIGRALTPTFGSRDISFPIRCCLRPRRCRKPRRNFSRLKTFRTLARTTPPVYQKMTY